MSTEGRRGAGMWNEPTVVRDALLGVMLGEYRVEERLGEGGMGIVYRGVQPVLSRGVAIKVLKPEFATDPKQLARLLEEARTVSAIRHPNIVDVFSFGHTSAGQPYFVMDLLEGKPLDLFIHEHGVLSVKEALDLIEQVFSALSAAHDVNVVHRDLKPSNIFVQTLNDGTRFAKLLDFGLAKRMHEAPTPTARPSMHLIGTPEYMAPEQIRSEPIGAPADLYAAGVTLYEMLAGRPPFLFDTAVETLMSALKDEPKPPSVHERSVPPQLDGFVLKLLEKKAAARPASAAAAKQQVARLKRELAQAETKVQVSAKHPAHVQSNKHPVLGASGKNVALKPRAEDSTDEVKLQHREAPAPTDAQAVTPQGGLDSTAARTAADSSPVEPVKASRSTFDDEARQTHVGSSGNDFDASRPTKTDSFEAGATVAIQVPLAPGKTRRWLMVGGLVVGALMLVGAVVAAFGSASETTVPPRPSPPERRAPPPTPTAPVVAQPEGDVLAPLPAPAQPKSKPVATAAQVTAKAQTLRSQLGALDRGEQRTASGIIDYALHQPPAVGLKALDELEAQYFRKP